VLLRADVLDALCMLAGVVGPRAENGALDAVWVHVISFAADDSHQLAAPQVSFGALKAVGVRVYLSHPSVYSDVGFVF
jgi:hypothetical protein